MPDQISDIEGNHRSGPDPAVLVPEPTMFYAATIFWLLILIFAAYGTYQLWAGLIKPPVLNLMLLPGTLAAQSGRMAAALRRSERSGRSR